MLDTAYLWPPVTPLEFIGITLTYRKAINKLRPFLKIAPLNIRHKNPSDNKLLRMLTQELIIKFSSKEKYTFSDCTIHSTFVFYTNILRDLRC